MSTYVFLETLWRIIMIIWHETERGLRVAIFYFFFVSASNVRRFLLFYGDLATNTNVSEVHIKPGKWPTTIPALA